MPSTVELSSLFEMYSTDSEGWHQWRDRVRAQQDSPLAVSGSPQHAEEQLATQQRSIVSGSSSPKSSSPFQLSPQSAVNTPKYPSKLHLQRHELFCWQGWQRWP